VGLTAVGDGVFFGNGRIYCGNSLNGATPLSLGGPVVDEERVKSGHWPGLVFSMRCISFSALTLMVLGGRNTVQYNTIQDMQDMQTSVPVYNQPR